MSLIGAIDWKSTLGFWMSFVDFDWDLRRKQKSEEGSAAGRRKRKAAKVRKSRKKAVTLRGFRDNQVEIFNDFRLDLDLDLDEGK